MRTGRKVNAGVCGGCCCQAVCIGAVPFAMRYDT